MNYYALLIGKGKTTKNPSGLVRYDNGQAAYWKNGKWYTENALLPFIWGQESGIVELPEEEALKLLKRFGYESK